MKNELLFLMSTKDADEKFWDNVEIFCLSVKLIWSHSTHHKTIWPKCGIWKQ